MEEQAHVTDRTYLKIGSALFILTAIEVALYFLEGMFASDWSVTLLVASLVILSTIKFVLVVMYYMHLKWDDRLYTGLFLAGLGTAMAVVLAMVAMYHYY